MATIQSNTSMERRNAAVRPVSFTRADLGAMALLVASLVGMFWKALFTSAMFFYRDISNYTYPSAQLIRELCRHGVLPYWNPYLNFGQPLLANPNLLFFYPTTLLNIGLPFDLAYKLHFVLHFALAGIGTYLLARTWRQSYKAAFFAAFVFVFSGPVLSLGNFYNTVACAAWIPWALLATDRALESRRLRSWVWLVVVFSLQWLAAEPLTMMVTFGLAFAYAFYRCGTRDKLWSRANFRVLAIFLLVGCGMLLLCAVQLLPAVDMLNNSHRASGLDFQEVTTWSVNPLLFVETLLPNYSGSVLAGPPVWGWLISDRNDPYNISNFLGFVPLFFALAGWALAADRRRSFVAGAAGIVLLLALGHFTPFYALARLLLPPLGVVRFPVKLLVHATLLVAILAGWGFDATRSAVCPWKAPRKRLALPLRIFLGCTIAALGAAWLAPVLITWPTSWVLHHLPSIPRTADAIPGYLVNIIRLQLPGLAGFCLAGILLVLGLERGSKWARPGLYAFALLAMGQLVMVNYDANPTVPKSFYTYRPPVLDEFKGAPGTYRFLSQRPADQRSNATNLRSFVSFQAIPAAQGFSEVAQGAFSERIQLRIGSMSYRVEGSINYDPERSVPPFLYDLKIYLNKRQPGSTSFNCLMGRLNVKYILSDTRLHTPIARLVSNVFNGSEAPTRLYEDSCFVPRAYVAGNSVFLADSSKTLDQLASPEFDALNTVILAAPPGSSPDVAPAAPAFRPARGDAGLKPGATTTVSGAGPAGQVEIVHRGPNSIILRAQLVRPGYIVLLDRDDPNWHATLDGRPAPVLRADQVFRAVYAAQGEHQIRFEYHQKGLLPGLIISLVTLAMLLALCSCKLEI